jgi:hypothetical protein
MVNLVVRPRGRIFEAVIDATLPLLIIRQVNLSGSFRKRRLLSRAVLEQIYHRLVAESGLSIHRLRVTKGQRWQFGTKLEGRYHRQDGIA